jgi:hypothetical protein
MPEFGKSSPAAGWFDDGHGLLRWWDGASWTEQTRAPSGAASPPVRRATGASTWIVGGLVALVLLIALIGGGGAAFLVWLGVIGLLTGLYSWIFNRRSWARFIGSRRTASITSAGALLAIIIGAIASPSAPPSDPVALRPASTATAQAVEAPPLLDLEGRTSEEANSSLRAEGYQVEYVTEDGSPARSSTDWIVTRQSPAAGTTPPAGSTITLTVAAPPEPVPAPEPEPAPVVAPAPAPAPAPVPVPVPAPAPAPAPVPAPAPAPAPATITPGAFCPDASVGSAGVAANGKTYICGGKGADANGKYHWNTTS